MKQIRHLLVFFILLAVFSLRAQKYTISGYISDAETGEKLIAANIFDQKSVAGTVSNNYGFYSLTLPADSVNLSFSYIGFQPQEFRLLLNNKETPNTTAIVKRIIAYKKLEG